MTRNATRPLHRFLLITIGLIAVGPCFADVGGCAAMKFRSVVDLRSTTLSLSDLLDAGTCATMLAQARDVQLGNAPLPGSVRVFRREDLSSLLERIPSLGAGTKGVSAINAPERIMVRRAIRGPSCLETKKNIQALLGAPLLATAPALGIVPHGTPYEYSCGLTGLAPDGIPLKVLKKVWNPKLRTWDVFRGCIDAPACLPFLTRLSSPETSSNVNPSSLDTRTRHLDRSASSGMLAAQLGARTAVMVQRGGRVSLSWTERDIRLIVPAVSLDNGADGERVRARILPGSRVISAVVVGRNLLRAGF
jgi:hypothetical protein